MGAGCGVTWEEKVDVANALIREKAGVIGVWLAKPQHGLHIRRLHSGFGFWDSGFEYLFGIGNRDLGLSFRDLSFGFRFSTFGCLNSGFEIRIVGFCFSGLGF